LAAKKPKIDDDAVEKKKQDVAKKPVPVDEPTTSTTAAPVAPSVAPAAPSAPLPVPVAVQPELPPIKPTEVSVFLIDCQMLKLILKLSLDVHH